jgi:hypothetical protein
MEPKKGDLRSKVPGAIDCGAAEAVGDALNIMALYMDRYRYSKELNGW